MCPLGSQSLKSERELCYIPVSCTSEWNFNDLTVACGLFLAHVHFPFFRLKDTAYRLCLCCGFCFQNLFS